MTVLRRLLPVVLLSAAAFAQTQRPADPQRVGDPPVEGFDRRGTDSIALTLPGLRPGPTAIEIKDLVLHDFSFEGSPVAVSKLHLKQLGEGIYEITSLAYAVGDWEFQVHDGAAGYFGLGEHYNTLNHSHEVIRNLSQDNAYSKGAGTYKPIPFYLSTTGYGLWVDTTAEAVFDMNAADRYEVNVSVPAERLRIVLFTGPEFPKILDRFTATVGRPMLPPYWAFAPWIGRDYHRNDADVREDVDKTRILGLPASVELVDSPWATGYNSYEFNPKQFSDITGTIKHVHEEGFKLVLWHTPWINSQTKTPGEPGFADKVDVESSNYKEAAAGGYFVKNEDGSPYVGEWWKGKGSIIDFTNPAAKQWWQDQIRKVIKLGADGFKDDDAEGNFIGPVKFADGTDQRLMRNKFAVLYNNAMEELIQKDLKGNGVLFARSATVGNHNIAMLWGGDNEGSFSPEDGLPTVVTAGLGAGMSGMAMWTADLGGYFGGAEPDPVNFMRWTQVAAFSPAMEVLNTKNRGPWSYGDEALRNYRKYAVLHMSLFPYRYAAAQQASKTGMPLMRALVLHYQDDKQARESKDEFLFGDDFLVAPVLNEGTQRPVYLPAGDWVNYWTGGQAAGGKTIVVEASMDVLPLYVRAGAVIAKIPEDVMTLVPSGESGSKTVKTLDDRRVYELISGFSGPAKTIEDFEGRTVTRDADSLKIKGKAAKITIRWKFGRVRSVTVNGTSAKLMTDSAGPYVEFSHADESSIEWK
ncbi:glycoside hydrolase family 31 protein [Terriglobus tenax]|uniref:glycoside hydrolase family 31 protein n=1 Tax=Terriglobus tenax TaxID=1111115 RepID=UPI0021DFCDEA|nr:TIM-barrel domain-containing protein [Terriglobus tenax]